MSTSLLRVMLLLVFSIFICCDSVYAPGKRKPTVMNDGIYDVIMKIESGNFKSAVKDRSKLERSAYVHHWRYRGRWSVEIKHSEQILLLDGLRVIRQSEKAPVIAKHFDIEKGLGPRRLQLKMKGTYVGFSEATIASALQHSTTRQRLSARFSNKAPITPICCRTVMWRVQIDLVDFRNNPAYHNGKEYRYILTVLDVFSRYTWLRPLTRKSSKNVAKELKAIFDTFGNPKIVQNDQGTEFKQDVSRLLKARDIRQIFSSPYHPELQGKVERSHRTLQYKMQYDLISNPNGTNWVDELATYEMQLNDMPRGELAWWSPLNVYYGREKFLTTSENTTDRIRSEARIASGKENERVIRRSIKSLKTPTYEINDRVMIRLRTGNKRISKAKVVMGNVIQRNEKLYMYKVKYHLNNNAKTKWISVREPTGSTLSLQKKRMQQTRLDVQISNRSQLFASPTIFNPAPDGNCQFAAIAHAIRQLGIYRSADTLRSEVIEYLMGNRYVGIQNSVLWTEAIGEDENEYITRMSQNAEFGDHLTLQVAAEIFNVQILIDSTIQHGSTILTPRRSTAFNRALPTIVLGHRDERYSLCSP